MKSIFSEKKEIVMQVVKHVCTDISSTVWDRSHDVILSQVWCAIMCAFYMESSDYPAVSTTYLFGKRLCSVTLAICSPGRCDSFLTTRILGQGDAATRKSLVCWLIMSHRKATSFGCSSKQTLMIPRTCASSASGKISGLHL